jgi:hypothetical protein
MVSRHKRDERGRMLSNDFHGGEIERFFVARDERHLKKEIVQTISFCINNFIILKTLQVFLDQNQQ